MVKPPENPSFDPTETLDRWMSRGDLAEAVDFIRRTDEQTLSVQVRLSETPAPPFGEEIRGRLMAELMTGVGLHQIHQDGVGNVIGDRAGSEDVAPLVLSAHLDTVFPADTDVSVTREGDLLRGAGISDDARGLASLVALVGALEAGELRTRAPLRIVATVGEEGLGDLRGVKHLFAPGEGGDGAQAFVSLDGAGLDRIVVDGLGSRRYRITASGPGGHSWVDWGTPNPAELITRLGHRLTDEIELPADPKTTLTIARIGGGKSINAIPQEAWLEIDTRSVNNRLIDHLEDRIRSLVEDTNSVESVLETRTEVIGDRPGGGTPHDAALVQAACAATRAVGHEPSLAVSSTDANIPMSLGVPALTIGCGGEAGSAHTTDEWYRNVHGPEGIIRALYTTLLVAGLEG